jgi:uncharacterized protein YbjT (DUF2867 family)
MYAGPNRANARTKSTGSAPGLPCERLFVVTDMDCTGNELDSQTIDDQHIDEQPIEGISMRTVLVVGATGLVGGKAARLIAQRGHRVRALVREGSDANPLREAGIEVVRGDITKPETLPSALRGVQAVVTTAYGYARRRRGDSLSSVDDAGNRHLIAAAKAEQVERFVFTSILTADRAVTVPHFHQKAVIEDHLERSGLPFVALRPGGFLDTLLGMSLNDLRRGRFRAMADPLAKASTILSDDVARALVDSADAPGIDGLRIDLGMSAPVTLREIVDELAILSGKPIELQVVPRPLRALMFRLMGAFNPFLRDVGASMDYVSSGQYVADTTLQSRHFGPPPNLRDSLRRWLASVDLGAPR